MITQPISGSFPTLIQSRFGVEGNFELAARSDYWTRLLHNTHRSTRN